MPVLAMGGGVREGVGGGIAALGGTPWGGGRGTSLMDKAAGTTMMGGAMKVPEMACSTANTGGRMGRSTMGGMPWATFEPRRQQK